MSFINGNQSLHLGHTESLIVKSLRAQYNNFIPPALGGPRSFLNCFLALV